MVCEVVRFWGFQSKNLPVFVKILTLLVGLLFSVIVSTNGNFAWIMKVYQSCTRWRHVGLHLYYTRLIYDYLGECCMIFWHCLRVLLYIWNTPFSKLQSCFGSSNLKDFDFFFFLVFKKIERWSGYKLIPTHCVFLL